MQPQAMSTTVEPPDGSTRLRRWGWGALLVAVTLTAYLPVVGNGYVWDDDVYLTANKLLDSGEGLARIWFTLGAVPDYYPLTFTTFWLEKRLWGLDPLGYHVNNVLLHALNAVLLWRLLVMLKLPGAWLAAAVFALHPVNVESVAWVTQRKNVLSTAFYLAAFAAFLRFDPPAEDGAPGRRRGWWYALSLLCYLLAVLGKTVALTMPAVLLVVLWWKRGRIRLRSVAALVPFAFAAAPLCAAGMWTQLHIVRAFGPEWDFSLLQRCLIAGRVLWFYAYSVVWPAELVFIYPRWNVDTGAWWQYLFPIGAVAVPVSCWLLRRRIGRGPFAAVLCFGLTLGPASGFFNVYWHAFTFVADHVQYVAAIALIALLTTAARRLAAPVGSTLKPPAILAAALLLAALGALTWRQLSVYRHEEALWRHTIAHNPRAWMAHHNLGWFLQRNGRPGDAIDAYRAGLKVKSDYAVMHRDLALLLESRGDGDDAIEHYRSAVRHDPNFAVAYFNLANALRSQRRYDQAIVRYEQALRAAERINKAYGHRESAARFAPDPVLAHCNLGEALRLAGRNQEAIEPLERAIRLDPDNARAHALLALTLVELDRPDEAVEQFRQVLRLNPKSARAHHNVGVALAAAGRFDDAIAVATRALDLARAAGDDALARQISRRLELYRKGQP